MLALDCVEYTGPTLTPSMSKWIIPPQGLPPCTRNWPCSSSRVPLNITLSPAMAEPVMEAISNSVGARMMTRVHVSSPMSPVVPLIPANSAEIVIGPGFLMISTLSMAFMVPLMSVNPLHSKTPSIRMSTVSATIGCPALSISEMFTPITSPRMVLLSGSRS